VIQTFDPPGVGARDLRECLLLQLRRQGLSESLSAQILRDHFPAFLQRRLRRLASACHRPVEEVEAAYALIQRLQPRPSRGREPSLSMPVIPDLAVRRLESRYEVEWLDDRLPRLVMSTAYRRMLHNPDTPADAKQFLQDRLRHATWVIRAVEQRAATLLAIARCILTVQRDFLEHGPQALKPLTHAQVAQAVGRHPSTVGRAIAGKSIDTPYGIIRLERFFASRVPQRHPNDVLSDATVKAQLQALIRDEDPSTPLSDEGMVAKLRAHGACVARRTVAKYRVELKILPAYLRRQARMGRDPATAASPPAPRRLTPTVL
jgi:RNA polymerase sigma-54 factor